MRDTRMKRLTRRALALLFALALLWECGTLSPKAKAADVVAADGTVNFVAWEKASIINVHDDLQRLFGNGQHPILMTYKSNKTEYFVCATKENWRWQSKDYNLVGMPKISDPRFDDMRDNWKYQNEMATLRNKCQFATMGTFNSLWARYKQDGQYSALVFNVSNGNDGPGEYLGPGDHYDGQTYGGHKVRDTCFVVRPEETYPFRLTRDDDKWGFRMWNYDKDGDNEDVVFDGSTIKLSDDNKEVFSTIYVGTVINASALTHDFTVLNNQATTMGRPASYIPEGVTLRVANGGVLTVSGILLNDGKIVVEPGGLLVVREKSAIMPYHNKKTTCGGISSAGTVVVEKNGWLVGGGANGIYLTGGVVYNFGLLAAENFTATRKLLINNQKDAGITAGRTIKSAVQNEKIAGYLTGSSRVYGFGGSSRVCVLPYGRVNIADGAVYGDTSRYENYGSFGNVDVVKVFYHNGSSTYEVLSTPHATMDYPQADTAHTVTRREVAYASGNMDILRSRYEQLQRQLQKLKITQGNGQTFEQYVEQYFESQGIDLDEKVTVWDAVITSEGLPVLTIPWNQPFSAVIEEADSTNEYPIYIVKRQCPAELFGD